MNLSVGITNFTKKFTAIALSLLLGQPTFAQSTENQQIAIEGSLTDTSGNAINLANVGLSFYVLANGCYLYNEWTSEAGDGQGNINHRLGKGTMAASSPNSFSQNLFFGNVNGKNIATDSPCSVSATDTRLVQVYYPAENISATIKLGTVPYAQSATMLGGKTASQFVQTSTDTNTLFSGGAAGQYLTKSASGLTWTTSTLTSAQISTALGYTPASTTVALTASSVTTALGYTPANSATLSNYAARSSNLSDLTSSTAARTNLGLGTLSTKNSVDLSTVEVTGTLPVTKLPSMGGDVSNSTGSGNITVTRIRNVTVTSATPMLGQVLAYDGTSWAPTSVPAGLGTVTNVSSSNSDIVITNNTTTPILTLNAGTSGNQILRLDSAGRLPAIDASNVTTLNASQLSFGTLPMDRLPAFSGDASTVSGSSVVTVNRLRGVSISTTAPVAGQVLSYSGTEWVPINPPAGAGAMQGVNNLSEISSVSAARTNLGLGSLATKNTVTLTSEVSGVLPVANGGSKWSQGVYGIYSVSNTSIGSSTTSANTALYVTAPVSSASTIAASINNTNANGYGLKINADNASAAYYGLRVSSFDSTNFVVLNNGNVGVGLSAPGARLQIAGGSTSLPGFRLTSGSLTTTPMPGAVEYDGSSYYVTDGNSIRRAVATGSSANTIDSVSNINSPSSITLSTPNSVVVSSSVASTNYQNGALVVKGGLGVNGNGNFSGSLNAVGGISTSGSISTSNNIFAGAVTTPFLYGSTVSGGSLAIDSTSDGIKGNVIIAGNGGNVGIGVTNPAYRLHIRSLAANTYIAGITPSAQNSKIAFAEDGANQLFQIMYDASGIAKNFFTPNGTNYINNTFVVGSSADVPGYKMSVYGPSIFLDNLTVSKTLILNGTTTQAGMQFSGNSILSTPIAGAVEYDGLSLFYTNSSPQRRRIAAGPSGIIDNVTKVSYNSGNLTLEGNTAGTTPTVVVNNLGAGTVALQVNDSAVVSGSIKLSGEGADTTVTCAAADEGKQRYNNTLNTMEYCDGTYWQGIAGVTHCTTASGGTSFTLVGKAGTAQAFCISTNNETAATYANAASACLNKVTSRGSTPVLCSETQYQGACKQYSVYGAQGETKLPGLRSVAFWLPAAISDTEHALLAFNTTTANVCNVADQGVGYAPRTSSYNYRCCYQ